MLGAILLALAAGAVPTSPVLYRIELTGSQTLWSEDRPVETGNVLVFHRHPGGVLVSVRKGEVRRLSRVAAAPVQTKELRPGDWIDIGATGGGAGSGQGSTRPLAGAARGTARSAPLLPGEAKGGTALFNPDRTYRPEWDGRQVPGLNLGYPNSPNDYREGRTFAHPPAPAVQTAPGAPPTRPQGSGEVPRAPGT